MNNILNNLKDPSWWFTAVFVAILASLIAAFTKDFLGRLLSTFSARYKYYRDKQREKKESLAASFAADSALLIILLLLSLALLFLFVSLCIIFMLSPLLDALLNPKPTYAILFLIVIGLVIAVFGYYGVSSLMLFKRAISIYLTNKKVLKSSESNTDDHASNNSFNPTAR